MSFSHNDHYHSFLLRQVPAGARRALDAGCGSGTFARLLATRVDRVDAIDRSAEMIAAARPSTNVTFRQADIRSCELATHYDFISCIAMIHHVPFAAAVGRLRDALAPGGVLAILGLSRPTLSDYLIAAIGFAPNRVRRIPGWFRREPPVRRRRSWTRR